MKRIGNIVLVVCLLSMPAFLRAAVKPQVKPYNVSPDLKELANKKMFKLSPEMQALLSKNLFGILPSNYVQPFHIYEENDENFVPSFVTVDSVVHLYHVFFDSILKQLEEDKFFPLAKEFTGKMLVQCRKTYMAAPAGEVKEAALRNVAYMYVAAQLLGLKTADVPATAKEMAQKELALIATHGDLKVGAILPYAIDYTQFVPRGHYTRTEDLKKYFKGVMWYGLSPLTPRSLIEGNKVIPTPGPARQALLLADDVYAAKLTKQWDTLYSPIAFFVGFSDDLRPDEIKRLSNDIYGKNATLQNYTDKTKFARFEKGFIALRMPEIIPFVNNTKGTLPPMPDPHTPQMRMLGQRYTPDSEIFQRLTSLKHPIPQGLDVMAVLGSPRAEYLLDKVYKIPETWDNYVVERQKLKDEFGKVTKQEWTHNLYWSWLWVIKGIIRPSPEGYPSFMLSDAWHDRNLQAALAFWAELRHDTILYVKQSFFAAECGDGGEEELPPPPKGYVEPNIEVYDRLAAVAQQTRMLLGPRGLMIEGMDAKLKEFEDMVTLLKRVSEKELQNEVLTTDEYGQIRRIGSQMDFLTLWVLGKGKARTWDEIASPTDKNMACVADVHTAYDNRPDGVGHVVLEEGVGHAFEIYVVVPIEGKLWLTRGAVFSYYEFTHPFEDRLTDEKWQKMLGDQEEPLQPEWIGSFTVPKRATPGKTIVPPAFHPQFHGC